VCAPGRNCRPVADYALSSGAEIQKGIEHHLTQVSHLKKLLNERACPWNRLPTEILARVFFFCRPLDWGHTDQHLVSFMRRTNVCSRWRTVAIHTPELWAVGPCWSLNRTAKVLERAKEAPLEIQYRVSYSYNDERTRGLLDLLGRIDRVRHIDLECHSLSDVKTSGAVVNALYRRAPTLEHLRIVGLMLNTIGTEDPHYLDSGQLFGQQAPNLRHLCLESCALVSSDILRFSSLRTLRLKRLQSLSLEYLMRSLGEMPGLQDIHLQNAIKGTDPEQWTDMSPIQLPFLRTLVVEDSVAVVRCLAKHLQAIQLSQIDFTCTQLGSDHIIELLCSGLIPDGIIQFRDKLVSASIHAPSYNRSYAFAVSSSPRPPADGDDKAMHLVAFIIKADNVEPLLSGTTDAFRSMLSLLGSLRLHALAISSEYSDYDSRTTDNSVWLRAFPMPYDCLRELQLSGSIASGLIDALGHHEGGLREVDMRNVTFGTSTLRDIFLKHLKLRGAAKIPLRKLDMQCKGLTQDDESRIQTGKWAQDIFWDHVCDSDDEEEDSGRESEEDNEDDYLGSDDSERLRGLFVD
jgi:hypothetical protein